jgi:signal transduction histidine kinase
VLVGAVKQYAQLDLAPLQHVDLHELIDSTLLILGGKIGDAVTVVRDFDPALPRIDAYAAELNQVWSNLIDNALYAMSGAGTLIVRTRPGHDRVVVEVIDTGSGLSAGLGDRIFEPFFTTKPVGAGTGLGLDISWRIVVNRHHGQLTAESEPGRTVFRGVLPVRLPRDGTPPGRPRTG